MRSAGRKAAGAFAHEFGNNYSGAEKAALDLIVYLVIVYVSSQQSIILPPGSSYA